ncbi:MAG: sensor domain-containing diguanylate cyclase [Cyanobacteriota bacterium]|nr:sensor domain-containing diguanylate cyclase [Cyanobacteriota bacterium]
MPFPLAQELDVEVTLYALNYATRMIASALDSQDLVKLILDTMVDFGQSQRVALWQFDEQGEQATIAGEWIDGELENRGINIDLHNSPLRALLESRQARIAGWQEVGGVMHPQAEVENTAQPDPFCLCLPLLDNYKQVIGVLLLALTQPIDLAGQKMLVLNLLATLMAVSLENSRLFKLATLDALTGLYSRRYLEIRLQEEIRRIERKGGHLALLITDIDYFKKINDTYGHPQGDSVLRELAQIFQSRLRRGVDVACRYGGEEFVVILTDTDQEGSRHIGEVLRQACESHEFLGFPEPFTVTLSGGLAVVDQNHLLSVGEFLQQADAMLYQAKRGGRNRICFEGELPSSSERQAQ